MDKIAKLEKRVKDLKKLSMIFMALTSIGLIMIPASVGDDTCPLLTIFIIQVVAIVIIVSFGNLMFVALHKIDAIEAELSMLKKNKGM